MALHFSQLVPGGVSKRNIIWQTENQNLLKIGLELEDPFKQRRFLFSCLNHKFVAKLIESAPFLLQDPLQDADPWAEGRVWREE